jgi:hypothetical protein
VGNLIYYNYINSAIVAPDAFDIITLPPGVTLSNNQRRNLASIAKILQFAASKKGVCLLNYYILNVSVSLVIIVTLLQNGFLFCSM